MATERKLAIVLTGEDRSASKTLRNVSDEVDNTSGKLANLGSKISPAVTAAAASVVAGVGFALKGAFDAAVESQKISRETERVIKTTGAASWTTAEQVSGLAESLSNLTGADDELVQSTANLLLTFTNVRNEVGAGNDVFDQATGYALDLAAVMGTDASSAAVMLGKALNDPVRGMGKLTKAGVTFNEQQRDQIKTMSEAGDTLGAQKIILAELGKEFGGAAEAAQTPLDQLKVKLGNLQEQIGATLVPIVSTAADGVEFLVESFQALPDGVQTGITAVAGLATIGAGVVTVVAKLADVFAPVFEAVSRGIASAQEAIYGLTASMTKSSQTASFMATALTTGLAGALAVATVAMIGFSFYQRAQAEDAAEAAAGQDAYAEAINKTTGSLQDNVNIATAKLLADKNIADNLTGTTTNLELLGNELANSGDSFEKFRTAFKESQDEGFNASSDLFFRTEASADSLVEKMRELAAGGDVVAQEMIRLKDSGELNNTEIKDLVLTFDDLQDQYENAGTKGSATTRVFEGMAGASTNAAAAVAKQVQDLKTLADELRAQTDPWFAAYRSQTEATKAQEALNVAVRDYGPNSKQAKDATYANATAAIAYKGDILELKSAQADGAGSEQLLQQFQDLKGFGFDPNSQAAKNLSYDILGVGNTADAVDGKGVHVPVTSNVAAVNAELEKLRAYTKSVYTAESYHYVNYGTPGNDGNYYTPWAKGGRMTDGWFTVGEEGPEIGHKIGSSVRIFSNRDSSRMLESAGVGPGVGGDTVNVYVNGSNASAYDIGREVLWSRKVAG
jgi:hypothetical protein